MPFRTELQSAKEQLQVEHHQVRNQDMQTCQRWPQGKEHQQQKGMPLLSQQRSQEKRKAVTTKTGNSE
eukprot:723097-Prorocentrum_lima.AAC.1